MNSFRKVLAEKAFRIMDKDKSGKLNIDDIKGVYNGKMHPDVKSGKKTEDEILGEFLDTFELHYSLSVIKYLFIIKFLNIARELQR
jgi:Ca2+-binding EF-hand superfamily protein